MGQFGGGRLGGPPLAANTAVQHPLRLLPKGPIARLQLEWLISLKSSAAAFVGVVNTSSSAAAEGVDDVDLLFGALISRVVVWWEQQVLCGNLPFAQWRTILGLFNTLDVTGTLTNAFAVPSSVSSATQFRMIMTVPVSLERWFDDGGIFQNGSARLSAGLVEFSMLSSLTPSVVLANGTAVVSGLSVSINAETGSGTENDVGPLWQVTRTTNFPNVWEFGPGLRLFLGDVLPVGGSGQATTLSIGPFDQVKPSFFQSMFQSARLPTGGFDVTARMTPLLFPEKGRTFMSFAAGLGGALKADGANGATSLGFWDVIALPLSPDSMERVSRQIGAGGPVSIAYPNPKSIPPGNRIPGELVPFAQHRIYPGTISDGGSGAIDKRQGPSDAAAGVMQRQGLAARLQSAARAAKAGGLR